MSENIQTPNNANVANNTQSNGTPQVKQEQVDSIQVKEEIVLPAKDTAYLTCSIQCSIRRKPGLIGLPGQDPAERIYKIGGSLDARTRVNLKGISGELETKFMPSIVGRSSNDPLFMQSIDEYWSSISRIVPSDEPFLKDHEKGIKFDIKIKVLGRARKERLDNTLKVEDKIKILNEYLVETTEGDLGKEPLACAILDYDSVSDFLLLNYALKYSRVANSYEDIDNSPKILFYIFEKAVSVKNALSFVDLTEKAMKLYVGLKSDENRINGVLLGFNENIKTFDTITDKLLRIFELYNVGESNMRKFVTLAEDKNWEIKYLIDSAISEQKLRQLPNSTAIHYGETLIGLNIDEAVSFLNSEKGEVVLQNLKKELNIK